VGERVLASWLRKPHHWWIAAAKWPSRWRVKQQSTFRAAVVAVVVIAV
jgi:hypothetical protein